MPSRPVNAVLASVAALLPVPAMMLLDRFNRGCGDGLCGFIPGLMILGGLAALTIFFLARSVRRQEQPVALRLAPLVLWGLALVPMVR